ncbi:actin depolymerizing factor [Russula brevipes]|nr:actin depolymerizing factor [Russula brevipes]
MSSGVTVNSACLDEFQALKLRKKSKYIIFRLNDEKTEIIVDKTSTADDYETFLEDLPEDKCRWAVYDLEFHKEEGGRRSKITFIQWSPSDAKIKDKMVTASSREALRRSLVGIAVEIQGTDPSEVAYETVLEKAQRLGN